MKICSFTTIIGVIVAIYLGNTIWVLHELWYPQGCNSLEQGDFCLKSVIHENPGKKWTVKIFSSSKKSASSSQQKHLWTIKEINFNEETSKVLNVTLPFETKKNGSMYLHIFVHSSGKFERKNSVQAVVPITDYAIPVSYIQLLDNGNATDSLEKNSYLPETHWRPALTFYVFNEPFVFDRQKVPGELLPFIRFDVKQKQYLPILYVDELSHIASDLQRIKHNMTTMELTIFYKPISMGRLRFWLTLTHSMEAMKALGFTNKDIDDIKGIFTGTNLFFLTLTFIVSIFHVLFDFLAFKNDISYWKSRETMAGLSIHTVVYRCVSTIIIFLYLLDQQTSLLVLVPAGIGSIIELWKVQKALKIRIFWYSWRPHFEFGQTSDTEKHTKNFDHQAITYLSYIMYPLCLGAAVYSLFYVPHKSWYSWVIQSLVNAVYAFGFLFMLPQLFINYKLKSVAHLPWRAFMYKAFNTFIDDVFAFIVRMPTSHRLACFRDDIVFFCYLYQLWLYPVDKSRANEFGQYFEEEESKGDPSIASPQVTEIESKKDQ